VINLNIITKYMLRQLGWTNFPVVSIDGRLGADLMRHNQPLKLLKLSYGVSYIIYHYRSNNIEEVLLVSILPITALFEPKATLNY
jgi:hypothetical protein